MQVLRITDTQNNVFQMQRDSSGTWGITLPTPGTADQSLAGAAETQVGALRIVTTLDISLNLSDAGLNTPAYTIELTFEDGLKHVIQVGNLPQPIADIMLILTQESFMLSARQGLMRC